MNPALPGQTWTAQARGFSMLELVIVIAILGIVAAIAVPRLSRGTDGAADAALKRDLATMRNALELFRAEHNGALPPAGDIMPAMLIYSDHTGKTFHSEKNTTQYFGPYLREPPPLPVGRRKGNRELAAVDAVGVGWIYNASAGTIKANTDSDEKDASGTLYSDY